VIEFAATTHPGNRYQHNEDSIGWSEKARLWFVADGMGGHSRGDIASATVKKAILNAAANLERSLSELVLLAHEAVLLEGIERHLPNMGSTLVMARVSRTELTVSWCGDSRAYLWRTGELIRVTRDHSLLEQLLENGVVAPEEAFGHPRRNVLLQALGINDPRPEPGEIALTLADDDLLLLCSDGIHDELPDGTIADVLRAFETPQDIVDELERRVLSGDARDNLSVIALRFKGLPEEGDAALNVVDLREYLQAIQHPVAAGKQQVVDTLELPVAADTAAAKLAQSAAANQGTAVERSGQGSPSAMASELPTPTRTPVTDPGGRELWLVLAGITLLVLLVLLLT